MNQHLENDIARYKAQLNEVRHVYEHNEILKAIVTSVTAAAASAALGAGFSDRRDDGGASTMIAKLKGFLHGVEFGMNAERGTWEINNLGEYADTYRKITRESDPKYKEYLRLKEIYGDKNG